MKSKNAAIVCVCLGALLLATGAEAARKPPKLDWRSRDRQVPSGWCPLVFTGPLPEFTADGTSATVRFEVDGRSGQRLDEVYIVEKSVYQSNLVFDSECGNGFFFDPFRVRVTFLETFDSEANGWRPFRTRWDEDNGNGALFFDTNGLVAVVASGLKKGTTYVVGAQWYTDPDHTQGAVLNIRVDPSGQLGCGPEKAGDLEAPSPDE